MPSWPHPPPQSSGVTTVNSLPSFSLRKLLDTAVASCKHMTSACFACVTTKWGSGTWLMFQVRTRRSLRATTVASSSSSSETSLAEDASLSSPYTGSVVRGAPEWRSCMWVFFSRAA